MSPRHVFRALLIVLGWPLIAAADPAPTVEGYRGIWFTLGQRSQYGDKYSGGLGTYTANHVPIAIYSEVAKKTFFVYGGTPSPEQRHLLIMAAYYDHATGQVPRPVVVHDKKTVNDPHDNAAISIDGEGYLWVFVSGRAQARRGFLYRSTKPYDIAEWERVDEREMTYPQPHYLGERDGFFYLFTKYTHGRELYFSTSLDGRTWSPDTKLAGFGGHYQVSAHRDAEHLIATTFMYHPGGDVDRRTNLYYAQTADLGKTWTTADGRPLTIPLATVDNPALLIDYQSRHENVYIHDLNFDRDGRPVILYLTSHGAKPGPNSGPYTWLVTHFTGNGWETHPVTSSDHDYDTGSLYVKGDTWTVIGPTAPGPFAWSAGGEISLLTSTDHGQSWTAPQPVTRHSPLNHSYTRRPLNARDPFFALWADGNPEKLSASRLYFCDSAGKQVRRLPTTMPTAKALPEPVMP